MGGKVTVRAGVPILLGGAGGGPLVRSLLEVAAWANGLANATETFPSTARNAFLLCCKNNGVGQAVQAEKITLQLPISLLSFEKKNRDEC
jgi:hypothetical protein